MIGGGGEKKTLLLVARHADIWHGFGSADTIAHKHEVLDRHCADIGRDPDEIERSAGVSPRRVESAPDYHTAGTRMFTLGFSGPDYDLGPVKDWLAWRDEVNAG